MARINIQALAVGGGVGLVDSLLEAWDKKEGRDKPFRNGTDIGRLVFLGGGVAMTMFDLMPDVAEPLMIVGAALTVKTVVSAFREGVGAYRPAGRVSAAVYPSSNNAYAAVSPRAMRMQRQIPTLVGAPAGASLEVAPFIRSGLG